MTLGEYIIASQQAIIDNPTLRKGQAYYNVLRDVRPDLADEVVGSSIDPYYENEKIPAFLSFVAGEWEQQL